MAYQRKTRDVYDIMGNYGYGWDVLLTDYTYSEAKKDLVDYRKNEPQYAHKIVSRRERVDYGNH